MALKQKEKKIPTKETRRSVPSLPLGSGVEASLLPLGLRAGAPAAEDTDEVGATQIGVARQPRTTLLAPLLHQRQPLTGTCRGSDPCDASGRWNYESSFSFSHFLQ